MKGKSINSTFIIKKGRRKTSKAVLRVDERCKSLIINDKSWNEYFSDINLTKRVSDIISNHEASGGKKIVGYIDCIGGGCSSQCRSVCDALSRFIGLKVNTDMRHRRRSRVGKSGPNSEKPNNRR
jgi:ribosomal protein S9